MEDKESFYEQLNNTQIDSTALDFGTTIAR